MAVRQYQSDHATPADGLNDRRGLVSGVNDDDFVVIADDPNIVVHFPTAAIEIECARGNNLVNTCLHHNSTTERNTSQRSILASASSPSSLPMRSLTNPSRFRRPC